jgi:hypothetical protein
VRLGRRGSNHPGCQPRASIDRAVLLATDDRDAAEPLIKEVLRRDRDAGLLQIDFAVA